MQISEHGNIKFLYDLYMNMMKYLDLSGISFAGSARKTYGCFINKLFLNEFFR